MRSPPSGASTYYKVVAVVDRSTFVSIFDGKTTYRLNEVTAPRGGCWVCPDLLSVVQHSARLPSRSARLGAPRAVLQVSGWDDPEFVRPSTPGARGAIRTKRLVSHVMPLAVLPYTAAAQPGTPVGQEEMLAGGITSGTRPRSAPRPPEISMAAGRALRIYGGGEAQAQRLQAQTIGLHEDVLLAEARLRHISASVTVDISHPSPWVRRALARTGRDAEAAPTPAARQRPRGMPRQ
jgi:hypothetical protein